MLLYAIEQNLGLHKDYFTLLYFYCRMWILLTFQLKRIAKVSLGLKFLWDISKLFLKLWGHSYVMRTDDVMCTKILESK
jgi:hypothetical protein